MTTGDEYRPNETDMHEELARVGTFLRRALRFWAAPLAMLVVGAIASGAFLLLKKPTYRSETVILYSEGIRQGDSDEPRDAARTVSTRLKEIITSRSELGKVVDEFHLYPGVVREHGVGDAVEELRKHVEFKAPGGDTFSIAFEGTTPPETQRVTSRLAEVVIEQDAGLRKKQALVTRDFLELEKMGTEARLRESEQGLASFMAAHPRFALDATPLAGGAAIRATMAGAPVAPISPFLPSRPRPMVNVPAHSDGAATPSTNREAAEEQAKAVVALQAAQARLADLSSRFTPQYPDVRNAQAEFDRAKARVAAAAVAVAGPVAPEAHHAAASVGDGPVQPAAAPARAQVRAAAPAAPLPRSAEEEKNLVALETDWVKLTRGVTEARQHQDHVEAALFKADMAASSEVGGHGVQVSIIDPAYLPERPVPPGRSTIVALILGAALALGILGSLIGAALDDRIHDQREIMTLAPVLVTVPRQLAWRDRG